MNNLKHDRNRYLLNYLEISMRRKNPNIFLLNFWPTKFQTKLTFTRQGALPPTYNNNLIKVRETCVTSFEQTIKLSIYSCRAVASTHIISKSRKEKDATGKEGRASNQSLVYNYTTLLGLHTIHPTTKQA